MDSPFCTFVSLVLTPQEVEFENQNQLFFQTFNTHCQCSLQKGLLVCIPINTVDHVNPVLRAVFRKSKCD